jgi:hypothetical protein
MIASAWRWQAGAIAALLLAAVSVPTAAGAGEVAERAAAAEALLDSGKAGEALAAFDQAAAAFWIASPLQLRVATLADDVKGFGSYTPRADAAFRPGDTLLVYLEPIGYGFTVEGDLFKVVIAADTEIRSPGGLVFGKASDFTRLTWRARSKMHEVHATISFAVPKLKAGDYQLVITLRDQGLPKTAIVTLPFKVAGD